MRQRIAATADRVSIRQILQPVLRQFFKAYHQLRFLRGRIVVHHSISKAGRNIQSINGDADAFRRKIQQDRSNDFDNANKNCITGHYCCVPIASTEVERR